MDSPTDGDERTLKRRFLDSLDFAQGFVVLALAVWIRLLLDAERRVYGEVPLWLLGCVAALGGCSLTIALDRRVRAESPGWRRSILCLGPVFGILLLGTLVESRYSRRPVRSDVGAAVEALREELGRTKATPPSSPSR